MPEARTPLKSLEEIKLMFQRFSFSPFSALSTLSPPQIKGSPLSFTSRLFTRGKAGSFTISTTPSSTDGSEPGKDSYMETSNLRRKLDLSATGEGGNAGPVEKDIREDAIKDAKAQTVCGNGPKQDVETDSDSDTDDELLYEAESPDEAALVHAARAYRCTLRGRSAESLLVDLPGIGSLAVQLLHILPFDSNRKRMSVVVRHPLTGHVVVYTKGADSVIMDLAETPKGNSQNKIEMYSPE